MPGVVLAARCRRPGSTLAGGRPGADNGTRDSGRRPHVVVRGEETTMSVLLIAEANLTEMVA